MGCDVFGINCHVFLGLVCGIAALFSFDLHLHRLADKGYLLVLPKKLRRHVLKSYVKNIWEWCRRRILPLWWRLEILWIRIKKNTAIFILIIAWVCIGFSGWHFVPDISKLYDILAKQILEGGKTADEYRGIAIRYFGIVAGVGAIIGYIIATARNIIANNQNKSADEQNRINERGRITESMVQAIAQIGAFNGEKPNIAIRLGGLYSLQRIMQDRERDEESIAKILYAYVRENLKRDKDKRDKLKEYNKQNFSRPEEKPFPLPEDIVSALNIISQFNKDRKNKFGIYEPESQSDFTYADFTNYSIRDIDFSYISFSHADFSGSNLVNVNFLKAMLLGVNFSDTQLSVVDFSNARFFTGKFCEVSLGSADFSGTDFDGLDLSGADLTNASNLTQKQVNQAFGDLKTRLPTGLKMRDMFIDGQFHRMYDDEDEDE